MKKPIGISIFALQKRYGDRRALEICAESGFDAVDFNLCEFGAEGEPIYAAGDDAILAYFSDLADYARSLGLEISQTHGRLRNYVPDETYNRWAHEVSRKDLLATHALGAPSCVIHSMTTGRWPEADAAFMHAKNLDFFQGLIPFAETYDVNLALETFGDSKRYGKRVIDFFGDSRELKKQFDLLQTDHKVLCMDTGHTNKAHSVGADDGSAVPDVVESIYLLGSDIKLLHLNDNNGFTDQHLPPMYNMQGSVPWKAVFKALDEIGYQGVYNFELSLDNFGAATEDAVRFLAGYLRRAVEGTL
ncbi:MAG: sugar phosphate isomerase/epimerase [Clostridia bacterium]|nr:sugar phosphate isomerase/epimerase [Clostridia bacterium]